MEHEHNHDDRSDENIDRAELNVREGKLSISGANAGQVFVFIGIAVIIIALGFAVPNILDSWRK